MSIWTALDESMMVESFTEDDYRKMKPSSKELFLIFVPYTDNIKTHSRDVAIKLMQVLGFTCCQQLTDSNGEKCLHKYLYLTEEAYINDLKDSINLINDNLDTNQITKEEEIEEAYNEIREIETLIADIQSGRKKAPLI